MRREFKDASPPLVLRLPPPPGIPVLDRSTAGKPRGVMPPFVLQHIIALETGDHYCHRSSLADNDHPVASTTFHTVGELGFEYFFKTILQSRLENRESDFDPAVEVALHPVRRSEPKRRLATVLKIKKAGKLCVGVCASWLLKIRPFSSGVTALI